MDVLRTQNLPKIYFKFYLIILVGNLFPAETADSADMIMSCVAFLPFLPLLLDFKS